MREMGHWNLIVWRNVFMSIPCKLLLLYICQDEILRSPSKQSFLGVRCYRRKGCTLVSSVGMWELYG